MIRELLDPKIFFCKLILSLVMIILLFSIPVSSEILSYQKSGYQYVFSVGDGITYDYTHGYLKSNNILDNEGYYLYLGGSVYQYPSYWDLGAVSELSSINMYNTDTTGHTLYAYGSNVSNSSSFVYLNTFTHSAGWQNKSVTGSYRYIRFYSAQGGGAYLTSEIVIHGDISNIISTDKASYNKSENIITSYTSTYSTNEIEIARYTYFEHGIPNLSNWSWDIVDMSGHIGSSGSITFPINGIWNMINGTYRATLYGVTWLDLYWHSDTFLASTNFTISANITQPPPPINLTPIPTIPPLPTQTPNINPTNDTNDTINNSGSYWNYTSNATEGFNQSISGVFGFIIYPIKNVRGSIQFINSTLSNFTTSSYMTFLIIVVPATVNSIHPKFKGMITLFLILWVVLIIVKGRK